MSKNDYRNVTDYLIRLLALVLIIGWCLHILKPFSIVFIWAVIISITIHPLYQSLCIRLGNRYKLTSVIMISFILLLLAFPTYLLAESLGEGIKSVGSDFNIKEMSIPLPDEQVLNWPVVGKPVYNLWQSASESIGGLITKYEKQLMKGVQWFFNSLIGTGIGFLQFLVSLILAGFLLNYSKKCQPYIKNFFNKLAGQRGAEFYQTTEITIRNVSKGILGVSAIQSVYLGLVFYIFGVPYSGLWALFCLILAVVQVGPFLVTVPVIIYLFLYSPLWLAIIATIFLAIGSLLDNILKPIIMGKGAPAPTIIIFLGSIGGFISSGFIGLFIGAIVLSLGYKLALTWLNVQEKNTD